MDRSAGVNLCVNVIKKASQISGKQTYFLFLQTRCSIVHVTKNIKCCYSDLLMQRKARVVLLGGCKDDVLMFSSGTERLSPEDRWPSLDDTSDSFASSK